MVEIKGGDKLESVLKKISAAVEGKAVAEIGFLEGSTYPDGTSVPMVAAINEYGAPSRGQPPRPFFRRAIKERSEAWGKNLGFALVRFNYNAAAALALVGLGVKEDIQDSIRKLVDPPLAESTIARKTGGKKVKKVRGVLGPAKPLIDTGHMLNSVGVRVKTGK